MPPPVDGIPGVRLQKITEVLVAVSSSGVSTLDTTGCEYIEMMDKGPNKAFFTCDGGDPVAGVVGDSDVLPVEQPRFIPLGKIPAVKFTCNATETANVYARLYS